MMKFFFLTAVAVIIFGSYVLFNSQGREEYIGALIGLGVITIGVLILVIQLLISIVRIRKKRAGCGSITYIGKE
jgi:hypothetical protein